MAWAPSVQREAGDSQYQRDKILIATMVADAIVAVRIASTSGTTTNARAFQEHAAGSVAIEGFEARERD